ncbi:endo alpha-1,4 polygalactosaminidase [Thermococcus sp.]|uniref:endo alpha-1,4 polygalactosaminidase n=1 Tax=Thermococcus sp. TaxID=35749 RepID=UPI0026031D89|nr:endo alpha-1,4 polygalactosaminidase [Thermococcus sp.]
MSGLARLALLILLFSAVPVSSTSFAVYYGQLSGKTIGDLKGFEILILPPTIEPELISSLSRNHTVVGYLSLATVGGWEPWAKAVPKGIVIGKNTNWNEKVVDFASPAWKRIVLEEAIPYILSRGFEGVFLDNVDYVDRYPKKKTAMVELIRAIRERYPGITIIVNRGFSIKEEIAPYIDYVLFEDFITYYNFSTRRYEIFKGKELEWELEQVEELKNLGVPILALSYANLSDRKQVSEFGKIVCSYARKYNVSGVYLAEISLQRVGIDPCRNSVETGGKREPEGEPERPGKVCGPGFILALTLLWRRFL